MILTKYIYEGFSPLRCEALKKSKVFKNDVFKITCEKGSLVNANYKWEIRFNHENFNHEITQSEEKQIRDAVDAMFWLMGEKACDEKKLVEAIKKYTGIVLKDLVLVNLERQQVLCDEKKHLFGHLWADKEVLKSVSFDCNGLLNEDI